MTEATFDIYEFARDIYAYAMAELQAAKGKWSEVAEGSGVSIRTIEKIARREIKDPGVSHIQKLANYFRGKKAEARA